MHGQKTFIYQVSEWYSQGTRHLCVQMEAWWIYSGVSIIHKGWDGGGGGKKGLAFAWRYENGSFSGRVGFGFEAFWCIRHLKRMPLAGRRIFMDGWVHPGALRRGGGGFFLLLRFLVP